MIELKICLVLDFSTVNGCIRIARIQRKVAVASTHRPAVFRLGVVPSASVAPHVEFETGIDNAVGAILFHIAAPYLLPFGVGAVAIGFALVVGGNGYRGCGRHGLVTRLLEVHIPVIGSFIHKNVVLVVRASALHLQNRLVVVLMSFEMRIDY